MRISAAVGMAAFAATGLAGCAGIPAAVSAASLYVDTILYLRTNKSSTDHIVSAAMERDCAVFNLFRDGALCRDAPPPSLIVEVTREVQNVPPGAPPPQAVAEVMPATLSDGMPAAGAAPLPARKPEPPPAAGQTEAADMPAAAQKREGPAVLVVFGSFAHRAQAEELLQRIARPDASIVAADVRGRLYHRVVVSSTDPAAAGRLLAEARGIGIRDAWLLPRPNRKEAVTTLAALP